MTELQLLTCKEVAQLLRISQETVRHLATNGELPGRKVGRAWRFPRAAVDEYFRRPAAGLYPHKLTTQSTNERINL
jgi:excisionase family DNA binding protein